MIFASVRARSSAKPHTKQPETRSNGYRCRGSHGVGKPIALHVPPFILHRKLAGDEGLDCQCGLQC
jgi:hypothetical protein